MPTEFVGVDGEGVSSPSGHRYVLLGVGDQQIENPEGLTHREIFPFLWEQHLERPEAAFVGFFLGYDFTMWLRSLPEVKAWLLLTEEGRRKRTLHGQDRSWVAPVRLEQDGWEVQLVTGRQLQIRPLVCECAWKRQVVCRHQKPSYLHICDSGAFFQTSLLRVINPTEWADDPPCTPEEYKMVEKGKARRADAGLDDEMRMYNRLENELLSRVMTKLDTGFRQVGVRLNRREWYGPGAPVAKWLTGKAPRREDLAEVTPRPVLEAASDAYFGGWAEVAMHGHIPGVSHEYDITSAYPHIISTLPCLLHGKWFRVNPIFASWGTQEYELVRAHVKGSNPYLGAMLHRRKDGSICRPQETEGWFWHSELDAAERAGLIDSIAILEAWSYHPCDCAPPAREIAELFAERIRTGKATPKGKALKLLMNSAYGKTAQEVGSAPFHNMIWAGLITSGCRRMILDAIATHPEGARNVIMVATDAVFFRAPHPGLDLTPGLGKWEHTEREHLTILKPGVYWDDNAREAIAKGESPLFKARGINAKAFAQHLEDLDDQFRTLSDDLDRPDEELEDDLETQLTQIVNLCYERLEQAEVGKYRLRKPPPLRRRPERFGGGYVRESQTDWEWFDGLHRLEQGRLRGRWFAPSGGQSVDEIEEHLDIREWLQLTRRVDLAEDLLDHRRIVPRRYGGLTANRLVSFNQLEWPQITYTVDFNMTTALQAIMRHRWETAGSVETANIVQSGNPVTKRHDPYLVDDVIRTAPYQILEPVQSAGYHSQRQRGELARMWGMDDAGPVEEYMTPDGSALDIFYGQLGTGQWGR